MAAENADVATGFETLYDDAVGDVLHGTGSETFEALGTLRRIAQMMVAITPTVMTSGMPVQASSSARLPWMRSPISSAVRRR